MGSKMSFMTLEDWQYILIIMDEVSYKGREGARKVVSVEHKILQEIQLLQNPPTKEDKHEGALVTDIKDKTKDKETK